MRADPSPNSRTLDVKAEKAYILILNWNNWKDTIVCLESVLQNSYPEYQVVMLDNGSTDGSEERLINWLESKPVRFIRYDRRQAEAGGLPEEEKALYSLIGPSMPHPLIFVQTGSDLGFSGGINIGLKYILQRRDFRYVWLLNNDTVIDKDALMEMVRVAKMDNSIGMVGSKLLYYHKPGVLQAAGGGRLTPWLGNLYHFGGNEKDAGQWDSPMELDFITGASLLVKKEALDAVGLMAEEYFLCWEDVDWCVRARRKGYRLLYCPLSRVWHKEGGTIGGISRTADYYWVRNGLIFIKKFYPYFLPLIPFSYLLKYTLIRTLRRQRHNFKAFMKGMADFFRGKKGEVL